MCSSMIIICSIVVLLSVLQSDAVDTPKASTNGGIEICVKQSDCTEPNSVCCSQMFFSMCKQDDYLTPDWTGIVKGMKAASKKLDAAIELKNFQFIENFVERLPISNSHPWSDAIRDKRYLELTKRYTELQQRIEFEFVAWGKTIVGLLTTTLEKEPEIPDRA